LIAMTTSWSTSATMDRPMANNSLQVRIFAHYASLCIAHKKWISIGVSFLYLVSCFEIKRLHLITNVHKCIFGHLKMFNPLIVFIFHQ
jgi:hypothetical protein